MVKLTWNIWHILVLINTLKSNFYDTDPHTIQFSRKKIFFECLLRACMCGTGDRTVNKIDKILPSISSQTYKQEGNNSYNCNINEQLYHAL